MGNRSVSSARTSKIEFSPCPSRSDLRRLQPGQLAAELAADRPPGAGHQHGLAGGQCPDLLEVGLDRLAPQQVLDLDLAGASATVTRPEMMSNIAGTVRVLTPASSAARTTCRTTAPGARGMAMTSSSISCVSTRSGIGREVAQDRQVAHPVAVLGAVVVHEADRD